MVHVIRVYYTTYEELVHKKIVEKVSEIAGSEPVVKQSWIKEFRHVEIEVGDETECQRIREQLQEILSSELNGEYFKIEHITV